MVLDPHILPLNYKADHPQTTIVLHIHTADCPIIQSLMEAYGPELPPKLIDIFEQFIRQLPKPSPVESGKKHIRPVGESYRDGDTYRHHG